MSHMYEYCSGYILNSQSVQYTIHAVLLHIRTWTYLGYGNSTGSSSM